ncbi:Leucine-rich repeat receptor-like protein kinase PXL1 [Morus notabilis]|uniref:Leucine-rich repeat receptor-like protein kinase PXL1 n=1 Tax=Morus notabilis TaxID=981085 RepID=W9RT90_9ROSA|nr:Leucine-rich repeat receptor-like protein kinase PXL1 [Morus notabilis]
MNEDFIIFNIVKNLFIGVIPTSWGKLTKLQALDLGFNGLSGETPSSFGNLTQLSYLYLSDKKLKGSIPPNIASSKTLNFFEISNNNFSGAIPKVVFDVSSLLLLNLSSKSFTGSLPAEVGKLKNIDTIDLFGNYFSDVASAIHYLHDHCEQLIIHCDLKPSNVLIDKEMVAPVSDLRLAKMISNTARRAQSGLKEPSDMLLQGQTCSPAVSRQYRSRYDNTTRKQHKFCGLGLRKKRFRSELGRSEIDTKNTDQFRVGPA